MKDNKKEKVFKLRKKIRKDNKKRKDEKVLEVKIEDNTRDRFKVKERN